MKTIIFAAVLVTFCITLQAQSIYVNHAVKQSFNREFKSTSNARWEKISDDVFFVMFDDETPNSIAYFDKSGELLIKGQTVSFDQTPESVQKGIEETIKSYEQKNGGMSVILAYQLTKDGLKKYYVNCGNRDFLLSAVASEKGKIQVVREVNLESVDGKVPEIAFLF